VPDLFLIPFVGSAASIKIFLIQTDAFVSDLWGNPFSSKAISSTFTEDLHFKGRYDTQHNGNQHNNTQHNDIQHNEIQQKELIC
jgi:hypothetical protein